MVQGERGTTVRFVRPRRGTAERLLWSRDSLLITRLAQHLPDARIVELADSGWCVTAPAVELTDELAAGLAPASAFGLADIDPSKTASTRYVSALGQAVHASGLEHGLGEETPEMAKRRLLDYFFAVKGEHRVEFQPIVDLRTMRAHEWECLFRPQMPLHQHSIAAIVDAAVVGRRPVDFDLFVVDDTLARIAEVAASGPEGRTATFGVNLLPASLLAPQFEAASLADRVRRAGLSPRQIVIECTEQQAIGDVNRLKRQVLGLRRLGFGFAVDDAGAGYSSFNLIACLEPSIIKIDREIVGRIGNKDGEARKALVEAFVSFSRRIGARLVAEGIETRRDLVALQECGVDFGQGFLLGRPSPLPAQPRRLRTAGALPEVVSSAGGWESVLPAAQSRRADPA
jgi:EAL domain-containing protein (putative c-di-GMP-specific phosphodiesterase class I)